MATRKTPQPVRVLEWGELSKFAAHAGLDYTHVGRVLRGDRSSAAVEKALEDYFGVPFAKIRTKPRTRRPSKVVAKAKRARA